MSFTAGCPLLLVSTIKTKSSSVSMMMKIDMFSDSNILLVMSYGWFTWDKLTIIIAFCGSWESGKGRSCLRWR